MCEPPASVEVTQGADPADNGTALHRVAAPSVKVTEPVGESPVTVAVNVTDWLKVDGFNDETSTVVLAAANTVVLIVELVLFAVAPFSLVVVVAAALCVYGFGPA